MATGKNCCRKQFSRRLCTHVINKRESLIGSVTDKELSRNYHDCTIGLDYSLIQKVLYIDVQTYLLVYELTIGLFVLFIFLSIGMKLLRAENAAPFLARMVFLMTISSKVAMQMSR